MLFGPRDCTNNNIIFLIQVQCCGPWTARERPFHLRHRDSTGGKGPSRAVMKSPGDGMLMHFMEIQAFARA